MLAGAVHGCATGLDDTGDPGGTGGAKNDGSPAASAGSGGTGGSSGVGGAVGSGGSAGLGGATSVGGSAGVGASSGTGGSASTGGTSDAGALSDHGAGSDAKIESGCVPAPNGQQEDCTNGIDDNGDCKIDCEDPACGTFACVDSVPSGWTGFAQVVLSASDAGAGTCAAPFSTMLQSGKSNPAAAPAECAPCTCDPPTSGPITCRVDLGSAGLLCNNETMTPAQQNNCVAMSGGSNGSSYGPKLSPAPSGNCAPKGGGLTAPLAPATWTAAIACSMTAAQVGAGCSGGEVCAPKPPSQAGSPSGVCVYKAGIQTTCPAVFTDWHVISDSLTESRDCAACACNAPACPTDGYVEGFTSNDCSGSAATTLNANAACVLLDNAKGSKSFTYHPSHGSWSGTCDVTTGAGAPTGSVAPEGSTATTFCCVP